jgi:hypothetical protein
MSEWKVIQKEGDVSTWKPAVNEVLEGIFTGVNNNIGPNKSKIYEVTTAENEKVGIWETTVLASKLDFITVGDEIRITYLGERPSTKGGIYHDYKVETRKAEQTEAEQVMLS